MEARPGTEKRCSHNLQSGPVKTWTAVFVIINISDRRSPFNIRNSLQNLCVFCRGKVSGERLISHGTYCQFRTREYSLEATSMKTLLFSHWLVCCSWSSSVDRVKSEYESNPSPSQNCFLHFSFSKSH